MLKKCLWLAVICTTLTAFGTVWAAASYDLNFKLAQIDLRARTADFTLQIQAADPGLAMGTSNIVFEYDAILLENPALLAAHNFSGGNYNQMTLSQPAVGRVSCNIELFAPERGTALAQSYMDMATVQLHVRQGVRLIDILRKIARHELLMWRTESPNKTVIFDDDEQTLLQPGTINNFKRRGEGTPIALSLASVSAQRVALTWKAPDAVHIRSYRLLRSSEESENYVQIGDEFPANRTGSSEQPLRTYRYEDSDVEAGSAYSYQLVALSRDGELLLSAPLAVQVQALPTEYSLSQNYPNPFNPSTKIEFSVPETARLRLIIFNTAGQKVRTLVSEQLEPGRYVYEWDGRDENGNRVASGVYLYRLLGDGFVAERKLVFMK